MHIYTITAFQNLDKDYGTSGSIRCFGYSMDFEYADSSVRNNVTDINEKIYNYVVIEKVKDGLNPVARKRWFYKYNIEEDIYESIEEPICVKQFLNFSIG